ncbi:CHASE3 domain-containing protein [Dactylosporangium sp. CA-152071]|uniref:CHASE3 domain-containing protein n=1 Tax=Dactylosporangium sp. CA-152071 TaxID=3239933 RepID=UPI003D8EDC14
MHGGLTLRLGVTCALFTLLISTAFAAILLSVYQLRESVLAVTRAERSVSAATTLERLLLDVEAGRRGFALTRDPAVLVPWKAAQEQIPSQQQELAATVAGDRVQTARVAVLNLDITDYLDDYADPSIALEEGAVPKNISPTSVLQGQRQISALRQEFDDFAAAQRRTVEQSRRESMLAGRRALVAGIGGFTTAMFGVAILTRSLAVMVVRPLRRLVSAADEVARGDLNVRVATDGAVEIGSMQRTFNSMVGALRRSRTTLSSVAAEQAALRRVATVAAKGRPAVAVFGAVTEEAGKLFGADATALVRFEPDGDGTVVATWSADAAHRISPGKVILDREGVAGRVLHSGKPVHIERPPNAGFLAREFGDLSIRSAIGAPVLVAGRTWGVLKALSTSARPLLQHDAARAAEFTDLVASSIASSQARADLTASRARVVAATDEGRRRIERDLHDGTQQRLIALLLQLRATEAQAGGELRERLSRIGTDLAEAIDELRELARGIHPSILSDGGLVPAVKSLGRRSPVPVEVRLDLPTRIDTKIEIGAYYVIAEALTNAIRHAHPTLISVRGSVADDLDGGALEFSIEDDGAGGADPHLGTGLIGLGDRIAALGGTMHIASRPGHGTTLSCRIPLRDESVKGEAS